MNKKVALSPVQRVEAALTLLKQEGRVACISVSAICKMANVNRSNLYQTHPEVVAAIKKARPRPVSRTTSPRRSDADLSAELKRVKAQYKALLRLALEQQAEIESLRKRMQAS